AIGFVGAVIFVGPPDTRADSLAGGDDEMLSEIVAAPGYAADPRRVLTYDRHAFVEYFDLVFDSFWQLLVKHHPIDVSFTFELQLRVAVSDFCDCQRRLQIDLHLVAGFQGFERDDVRAFQAFGFG